MDETTMEEMAKAYHEALKGKTFPKTRPFPDRSAASPQKTERFDTEFGDGEPFGGASAAASLLIRELAAVEFLLQCAVKSEKTKLLTYLRGLLYEVMRRFPTANASVPTERFLSPEMAKLRLAEYTVDRLAETDTLPKDEELYALNSRILALITLI